MSKHNGHSAIELHRIADHEERINTVLGVVFRRNGFDVADGHTPLHDLINGEETDPNSDSVALFEQALARRELLNTMIGFFFRDGPDPSCVLKNVFAVGFSLRPTLMMNMSQTDVANMLGETKANHSARLKKVFNGTLKKAGAKGFKAPGQKTEAACAVYAQVQKGNTNRRGTGKKLLRPDGTKGGIHYDGY